MEHRSSEFLEKAVDDALKKVVVGGVYTHFKDPEKKYRVVGIGIQEATDKVCVIYKAEYNKNLIFVRDLESWLEKPTEETERFIRVEERED